MFGMSFSELLLIGIVSLIVLGPEKLPETIRTVSLWIGRLRRSFNTIKADIEREIGADEIRRQLRNEEIMEKFRQTQSSVQNSIQSIKQDAEEFKKNVDLEAQVSSFAKDTNQDTSTTESTESTESAANTDTDSAAATETDGESTTKENTTPHGDA